MIVTFYSYKGGVGRTQLVANLAAFLCYRKGKKILLIDWDLEAPGLHFYFGKPDLKSHGIIDILEEYSDISSKMNGSVPIKDLPVFSKEKYCTNLSKSNNNSGLIDIIPAGIYDNLFNKRINSFDWSAFYNQLKGFDYIEFIKEKLNSFEYDYIFIDSRTGVTDYTGITNVQMPEVNIIITIPNRQNFEGSLKVIAGIENSPYIKKGKRKAIIFPILSKIDMDLEFKATEWHKNFTNQFDSKFSVLSHFLGIEHIGIDFIKKTQLQYVKDVAFEETILFSEDNFNTGNLSTNYINIAENLETVKMKIEKPNFIKEIIIDLLSNRESVTRKEIDEIVLSKLSDSRTEKQKKDQVKNQLHELSKEGIIKNISNSTKYSVWVLNKI